MQHSAISAKMHGQAAKYRCCCLTSQYIEARHPSRQPRRFLIAKAEHASPSSHTADQRCSPAAVTGRRQLLAALGVATFFTYSVTGSRSSDAAGAASTPSGASDINAASPPKLTGLSPEELADRIRDDFVRKQYYVTGNLSSELFADDCLFTDPTIKVTGWKFYTDAVKTLFDADQSKADLISLEVLDGGDLQLKWRLEGVIKPWPGHPSIKPYTGVTRYVQNSDGLISKHLETWDTSIIDVFLSVFWKGFGVPPAPPVAA